MTVITPKQIIQASAGSGKTTRLTNRYIELILANEVPDRILATTFTRKAASEIRSRIFTRLAGAATDDAELGKLNTMLGTNIRRDKVRQVLVQLISAQHRLSIGTIDSLLVKVGKSFAFEIGLPLDWQIADHLDSIEAQESAIRSILREGEQSDMLALIRLASGGFGRRGIISSVLVGLLEHYNLYLDSTEKDWNWLEHVDILTQTQVLQLRSEIKCLQAPLTKTGSPNKKYINAIEDLYSKFCAEDWEGVLKSGIVSAVKQKEDKFASSQIPENFYAPIAKLADLSLGQLLQSLKAATHAKYKLLERYDSAYLSNSFSKGCLSFSDLKHILSKQMCGLDELYYRLDCRYHHLLLDEFQDTSDQEWRLLEPMAAEILSKASVEHSILIVGDPKQAIYGWRGSRAEIIDDIQRKWKLDELPLTESYRSSPVIIDLVNRVFSNLHENEVLQGYADAVSKWQSRFKTHTTARQELPGFAQYIQLGNDDDKEECLSKAAQIVQDLVTKNPTASIGILVRRNATIPKLIALINKSSTNIKASEEGGNPLTDSAAVLTILSLLILCDHPGDTIAKFHVENSPVSAILNGEVSDLSLSVVRKELFECGYGAILCRWARVLQDSYPEGERRRLWQLVELGFSYDSRRTIRCSDFVELVKREKIEDPSAGQVRVMNIHQSKGLEFDIVILPELENLIGGRRPQIVWTKSPTGQKVISYPGVHIRNYNKELDELYHNWMSEQIKESLSVLYVALTRARQGLVMISSASSRNSLSFAAILKSALCPGVEAAGLIYDTGTSKLSSEKESLRIKDAQQISLNKPIKLRASATKHLHSLPIVAPSRKGKTLRLASEQVNRGVRRGIALHKLLEQVSWIDEEELPTQDKLYRLLQSAGFNPELSIQVYVEFLHILEQKEIKSHFMRSNYAKGTGQVELYRELPFAYRRNEEIIRGAIDRLVVVRQNGKVTAAHIVDFKSDYIASTADSSVIRNVVDTYRAQLDEYVTAVGRMCGIDRSLVSADLLLLSIGRSVSVIATKEI